MTTIYVNPVLGDWTQGTINVTNGSTAATFTGAGLVSTDPSSGAPQYACSRGDLLCIGTVTAVIGGVTSNTIGGGIDAYGIVLMSPWTGTTQTNAAYSITRYSRPATGQLAAAIQSLLTNGQASNPLAQALVYDDSTARFVFEILAGVPTLAVGATGTSVAALLAALQIAPTTGVVSHPNGMLFGQPPARRNPVINGQFDIWQRGTSFTIANNASAYTADRWMVANNGTGVSATVAKVSAPTGFRGQYALNVTATGVAAGTFVSIFQRFESQMIAYLDSQACTLSFDLNASTSAGAVTGCVYIYGNTALDNGTWSVPMVLALGFTVPVGSGKVVVPLTAAQTAGFKLGAQIQVVCIQSSAAGNPNVTLGSVQLELGTVAQPFEKYTLGAELALCQRYFQKTYNMAVAPGTAESGAIVQLSPSGSCNVFMAFPVRMRSAPTITTYDASGAAGKVSYFSSGAWSNGGAYSWSNPTEGGLSIQTNISGSNQIMFDYVANAEL